ncbi:SDR family NAD(P)-dependent oxidoreductase [Paradevosia shaoguanensis]|uniref:SDR family NAD(P)-dependent oxidoreductase n=1 Tax=Paradevosia shaoguanensis TaxID=1335043 RepID=UPI00193281C3|nr:SDR family oxidoreductase [Paradevosia shaoguanensis]
MTGTWALDYFDGKAVLVSGGTSGIGLAIAGAFAEAGAKVFATGVGKAELEAARVERPFIDFAELDVREDLAIDEFVNGIENLDVLVNCAGIIRRGDEHDPDVFAEVVDVNLTGTMRLCAACRPLLARQGGAILNTASVLSFFGGGLVPGYSASKGGISQLTRSLAIAYAPENIRVNAIAPGWIETPLTNALREDEIRNSAILGRTPMGRWGRPDDLTGAALFLCSPLAGFITGAILPVDGGYLSV